MVFRTRCSYGGSLFLVCRRNLKAVIGAVAIEVKIFWCFVLVIRPNVDRSFTRRFGT